MCIVPGGAKWWLEVETRNHTIYILYIADFERIDID